MTNTKKLKAEFIGQCIAKRRLAANLTQDQVAEKLGIDYEAVSRMERGKSVPTVLRVVELADIFGCEVQELLTEFSNRPDDQAILIKQMLSELGNRDREVIMETLNKLYYYLKKSSV